MTGFHSLFLHMLFFPRILRNRFPVASLFLFTLLPGPQARAAGPSVTQLDVKITEFKVTDKAVTDNYGTQPALNRVKAGEEVYVQCGWSASADYSDFFVDDPIDFTNAIVVDGKVAYTFEDKVFPNHYGKEFAGFPHGSFSFYKWTPQVPGKHTVGCRLDLTNRLKEKPEWKKDSESAIEVIAWRDAAPAEVTVPVMLDPPNGAKYELGKNMKIPIRFRMNESLFSLSQEKIIPELLFQIVLRPGNLSGDRSPQDNTFFIYLTPGAFFSGSVRVADTNPEEWSLEYNDLAKYELGEGDYDLEVGLLVGEIRSPTARRTITIHGPLGTKGDTAGIAKGNIPLPGQQVTAPAPKIRSGTLPARTSSAEARAGRIAETPSQTGTAVPGARSPSGAEIGEPTARDGTPGPNLKRGSSRGQVQVEPQPPQSATSRAAAEPSQPLQTSGTSRAAAFPQMLNFEAEDLFDENKAVASGGSIGPQSMGQFGSGWSNNAQLFWSGGDRGAVLDMVLDIPAAATYAVELYLTRAPDYGILRIEVEGKASTVEFQGYSPRVVGANPLQAGRFSLQAGLRRVSLMITGKYQDSSGYAAGIDRIRLYPVGGP